VLPRDHYEIRLPVVREAANRKAWELFKGNHSPTASLLSGMSYNIVPVGPGYPAVLRNAVYRLGVYFRREFEYDFVPWSQDERGPQAMAYLLCGRQAWDARLRDSGFVLFGALGFRWREWTDAPACWSLGWAWLHPFERRRGHLSKVWPALREKYGDFHIRPPLSPAMEAFLVKQEAAVAAPIAGAVPDQP
jgi:hypothetical protein